jgi:protein O-mannosyl-transferase
VNGGTAAVLAGTPALSTQSAPSPQSIARVIHEPIVAWNQLRAWYSFGLLPPKPEIRKKNLTSHNVRPFDRSLDKWILPGVLLLAVVTIAVYYPVVNHPFVNYDDPLYVVDNVHVKYGLTWETVTWAFTAYDQANWHPLTWLSHALDWQMFGSSAGGHHATSVLIHALNAVLLFWVLWKATGWGGRSLAVAAMFALHPINVESVAWVSERKTVLSMMFFLLALAAYRWYARQPGVARYTVVALLFVLALMAKPQVITFPCVLLLWDYWPLGRMFAADPKGSGRETAIVPSRNFSQLLLEKLPLFVLSGVSAAITVAAQRAGGSLRAYPLIVRLENAIVSYVIYMRDAFWPLFLAPFYPHTAAVLPVWKVLGAIILLGSITALATLSRQRHGYLLVGWLWFLGTLVPMIGLVQVGIQSRADRYAYLSFIGLFIMICWGVADWAEQRHLTPALLPAASLLVLLALTVETHRQMGYWADNVTLWSHTLQLTSANYVAEDNLGGALTEQGQFDEGMKHYRAALAINPSDAQATRHMALNAQEARNFPEAIEQYKKVISLTSDPQAKAEWYSNMGYAYGALKDYQQAGESFREAVALNPQHSRAWIGVGVVAQRSGNLELAIQAYTRSASLAPSGLAYILLSRALQQSGRASEAQAAEQRAEALSRNLDQARRAADSMLAH